MHGFQRFVGWHAVRWSGIASKHRDAGLNSFPLRGVNSQVCRNLANEAHYVRLYPLWIGVYVDP